MGLRQQPHRNDSQVQVQDKRLLGEEATEHKEDNNLEMRRALVAELSSESRAPACLTAAAGTGWTGTKSECNAVSIGLSSLIEISSLLDAG